jgi:collagenase-like PrtC family protease
MTLKEMTSIAEELPEIEFETFILNDGCAFDEGNCHTIHLPGKLGGPICMDNYQTDYRTMDNSLPTPAASSLLEENDALYQHWLWHRFSCGFSVTEEGYPYGPCGLCAISTLFDAGISAVKIAGRDSPTERKVKSVQMVREVLDKYRLSGVAENASDYAISLRKTPHLCDQGYMCYYPESRTVHSSSAADNLAPTKAERIKTLSL